MNRNHHYKKWSSNWINIFYIYIFCYNPKRIKQLIQVFIAMHIFFLKTMFWIISMSINMRRSMLITTVWCRVHWRIMFSCEIEFVFTHSARVVHSTSLSDATLRGRPTLGPYESFPDVLLRPVVRRTSFVRQIRTRRRCNVFLRPRRIRTSGKLSYGPKVERPLNVRGRLAEWVHNVHVSFTGYIKAKWLFLKPSPQTKQWKTQHAEQNR